MANDLNQCNFIGRLGADPETRFSPDGSAVCSFRIAVGWKGKEKEGAEWVSITAYEKLAEICGQYLKKGSQVFISGRMKTDKYEKDGQDRYITKIVADRMQMLGSKDSAQPTSQPQRQQAPAKAPAQQPASDPFADFEDSIPF